MKLRTVLLAAAACAIAAGPVFGRGAPPGAGGPPPGVSIGPPAGIAAGRPASVPVGPPSGISTGRPSSTPVGPPSGVGNAGGVGGAESTNGIENSNLANAADILGRLNAAHANAQAFAHANSNSIVGMLAAYQKQMQSALTLTGTAETNAITSARQQLASSANVTLTSDSITQVDKLLGLTEVCSACGT